MKFADVKKGEILVKLNNNGHEADGIYKVVDVLYREGMNELEVIRTDDLRQMHRFIGTEKFKASKWVSFEDLILNVDPKFEVYTFHEKLDNPLNQYKIVIGSAYGKEVVYSLFSDSVTLLDSKNFSLLCINDEPFKKISTKKYFEELDKNFIGNNKVKDCKIMLKKLESIVKSNDEDKYRDFLRFSLSGTQPVLNNDEIDIL